MNMKGEKYMKT